MRTFLIALSILFIFSCQNNPTEETEKENPPLPEAISLLGKPLFPAPAPESQIEKWETAKTEYEASPEDADKIIWYGRRTAYLGKYGDAIAIFSEGIKKHPEDARMYRHRGHRYISIREFDKAIADLGKATELIEGTENEIEPDGIPNARNTPISTLHGNIWYHLGLAYYLKHDWENALRAYRQCRAVSTNADNLVSSGHWLFMILNRMGRGEEATKVLEPINAEMNIVENTAYHQLCLFYKGEMGLEELQPSGSTGSSDAIAYGVANWYLYHGEKEKAKAAMKDILGTGSWNAFGYIAAEVDMVKVFN